MEVYGCQYQNNVCTLCIKKVNILNLILIFMFVNVLTVTAWMELKKTAVAMYRMRNRMCVFF